MRTPHGTKEIRRYHWLKSLNLTEVEAREFATLPRKTPALMALIQDRESLKAKFDNRILATLARGVSLSQDQVDAQWDAAIARLYTRRNWRVQQGAVGEQERFPRGSMNPWACYRHFEKIAPDPGHVSPWQLRKHFGKTRLERGLVLVQKAERMGGVSFTQLSKWIGDKRNAVAKARGVRKAQMQIELARLERLQEKMA